MKKSTASNGRRKLTAVALFALCLAVVLGIAGCGSSASSSATSSSASVSTASASGSSASASSETVQFTDSHTSFQQDDNIIEIVAVSMLRNKPEISLLLCFRQGNTLYGIVWKQFGEIKMKWVFPDCIIIHSHFKCRLKYCFINADGVPCKTFIMQLNKPCLSIRFLDIPYAFLSK